jgi:AAA+ ATPase superfamily predicted ATPase
LAFTLTPALADDFVGREEITAEMTKQLSSKNRIGFSLSGIRRVGKTSILKEVARRLSDEKIPVVYVSVWRISPNTVDEFVRVVNRATINAFQDRLPAKFKFEELLVTGRTALLKFLQNLKLSAKVAEDLELTVSYVRRETNDVDSALTSCFSLVEHLAEMTKTKSVLILDEFPSMIELTYGTKNQKIGDSIIKLIRTLYEDFRQTKLVVSGSYRETMRNLLAKQRSPFYKQLLLREVEPFVSSEYDEFIRHYLPGLRFANDEVKDQFFRITSGIPYNLQLLGTEIQLEGVVHFDSEKLARLVQTVLKKEGELSFKEFVNNLSPSEVKVLKGLAMSSEIKPNEIAVQQFIDKDTIGPSLSLLMNKGVIERSGRGVYRFTDNLFREWLKFIEENF